MSVIKKEIKRKVSLSLRIHLQGFRTLVFGGVEGSAGDITLPLEPAFL